LSKPFISVIVIAHRRGDLLAQALKSVRQQSFPRELYELMVVGDLDERWQDEVKSAGATFIPTADVAPGLKVYEAVRVAQGEVLSFLDDDDEFLPGKLEAVHKAFRNGADYYHNGRLTVNERGNILATTKGEPFQLSEAQKKKYLRHAILRRMDFNNSSISVRPSLIDPDAIRRAGWSLDTVFFFFALLHAKLMIEDPSPLTLFRLHQSQSDRSLSSFSDFLKKRKTTFCRFCQSMRVTLEIAQGTPYEGLARRLLSKRKLQLALLSGLEPPAGDRPCEGCGCTALDSLRMMVPDATLSKTLHSWLLALSPLAPATARKKYLLRSYVEASRQSGHG